MLDFDLRYKHHRPQVLAENVETFKFICYRVFSLSYRKAPGGAPDMKGKLFPDP